MPYLTPGAEGGTAHRFANFNNWESRSAAAIPKTWKKSIHNETHLPTFIFAFHRKRRKRREKARISIVISVLIDRDSSTPEGGDFIYRSSGPSAAWSDLPSMA
jgi:hypothetical protein